jgi:hypothetical protein
VNSRVFAGGASLAPHRLGSSAPKRLEPGFGVQIHGNALVGRGAELKSRHGRIKEAGRAGVMIPGWAYKRQMAYFEPCGGEPLALGRPFRGEQRDVRRPWRSAPSPWKHRPSFLLLCHLQEGLTLQNTSRMANRMEMCPSLCCAICIH